MNFSRASRTEFLHGTYSCGILNNARENMKILRGVSAFCGMGLLCGMKSINKEALHAQFRGLQQEVVARKVMGGLCYSPGS